MIKAEAFFDEDVATQKQCLAHYKQGILEYKNER